MAADAGGPPRFFSVAFGPARLHFALGGIGFMNLWMLLMGICFTTAISSGWYAGRPAGFIGIVVGLFVSALLGAGGVLSMGFAELHFVAWITTKSQRVQGVAFLLMHFSGLMWCFAVGALAHLVTRFLIHYVAA